MKPRKFTVVTQIHYDKNVYLIDYLDSCFSVYGSALRETFHHFKRVSDVNKSSYKSYLQEKYGLMSLTANSIILDAQGRLSALKELKKHEKTQLKVKVCKLESVINSLQIKLDKMKVSINNNEFVDLPVYRNLKRRLVAKKSHLNTMKQKLENLEYKIECGKYDLCFGTKKLLQKDYLKFVERRDSQLYYVGAKAHTCGNQLFQMYYDSKINQFVVQLRKDIGGFKDVKGSYVYGKVYFNYGKKDIINILKHGTSPLTYKIVRKNGRYYLYCTYEITREESDFLTRSSNGVIGLDFNKGFVTYTETNQFGHMVSNGRFDYRFGSGNAAKTDLKKIASTVSKLALELGKDVSIENLDFKETKSATVSKINKKYNNMLHSLAYRVFSDCIESACFRNKVWLHKVNPAWTSYVAEQKYCPEMKLNIHTGASFVIARRGQGYQDEF